jgi:hypothetical protein
MQEGCSYIVIFYTPVEHYTVTKLVSLFDALMV